MDYSEVQKEKAMKAMCEICEMSDTFGENFKCINRTFPCFVLRETFNKVIEILEE